MSPRWGDGEDFTPEEVLHRNRERRRRERRVRNAEKLVRLVCPSCGGPKTRHAAECVHCYGWEPLSPAVRDYLRAFDSLRGTGNDEADREAVLRLMGLIAAPWHD